MVKDHSVSCHHYIGYSFQLAGQVRVFNVHIQSKLL